MYIDKQLTKLKLKTPKSTANVTIYRNREIKKDKRKGIPATLSLEDVENNKIFEVIEKLAERFLKGKINIGVAVTFDDTSAQNTMAKSGNDTLVFKYNGKPIVVQIKEIMYSESEGSYTYSYAKGYEKSIMYSKHLKEFEKLIPPSLYYRIDKNRIVFGSFLNSVQEIGSLKVKLINGKELKISRTKAHGFWEWYKLFHLPIIN